MTNTRNMPPSYSMPPLEGGLALDESKREVPQPIQAESHLRLVTSAMVDLGAFDVVLKAFEKQQEISQRVIQRLEEQVKIIETRATSLTEMFSAVTELQRMEGEIAQQKLKLSEKDTEIVALNRRISDLQPKPEGVIHSSIYRLFEMATPQDSINADSYRVLWPFVRAWSTFIEWSESPDAKADQFTVEFRKVDSTILKLKSNEPLLKNLRDRVSAEIATTVSRSLFTRFSVSWDFEGQTIDNAKQYSGGGGQKIVFVKTALIMRDAVVIDKAEVECQ